jgi:phosphatidylserine/phosphatidylglycerophosphate/cardiolipin synthase-like enzyme
MAQILRTPSQKRKQGVKDIEKLYLQAIKTASNFIYIENQYFRVPPLATTLRELVNAFQAGGRKTPLYLFVVTNSSDDGIGVGTVSTYQMLNALGCADVMPGVAKLERVDDLSAQYDAAVKAKKTADTALNDAMHMSVEPFSSSTQYPMSNMVASRQEATSAAQRVDELKSQLEKAKTTPPEKLDIPGLNVHICTLVPPDTPKGTAWDEVYIHSKLMIIDDYFVTHGSANVNLRSMEVDSELNITHESSRVTQALREKLWRIHTNGMGVGEKDRSGRLDAGSAFKVWGDLILKNKDRKSSGTTNPYASLVEFYRDEPGRSGWD